MKGIVMLDFICSLEKVTEVWPEGTKKEFIHISEATGTPLPRVVESLSDALDKHLDIHEPLNLSEVRKALQILKQKYRSQLELREKRERQKRENAINLYDTVMDKTRTLCAAKSWYAAYRTVSYFGGKHEADLPRDLVLSICDESLRLGIKGKANVQELGIWLRKAIRLAMSVKSRDNINDALDFMDAYSEFFESTPQGLKILESIQTPLNLQVEEFNLAEKLNQVYPSMINSSFDHK